MSSGGMDKLPRRTISAPPASSGGSSHYKAYPMPTIGDQEMRGDSGVGEGYVDKYRTNPWGDAVANVTSYTGVDSKVTPFPGYEDDLSYYDEAGGPNRKYNMENEFQEAARKATYPQKQKAIKDIIKETFFKGKQMPPWSKYIQETETGDLLMQLAYANKVLAKGGSPANVLDKKFTVTP